MDDAAIIAALCRINGLVQTEADYPDELRTAYAAANHRRRTIQRLLDQWPGNADEHRALQAEKYQPWK